MNWICSSLLVCNYKRFIVEVIFVALLLLFSVGGCVLVAFGYKIPYIMYVSLSPSLSFSLSLSLSLSLPLSLSLSFSLSHTKQLFYSSYIVFLLLALVPLFLFFSYNVLAERLYADVCDDNDITIAGGNSAIKNGILPCNSSGIESLRQEYYGLINVSIFVLCCVADATMCT